MNSDAADIVRRLAGVWRLVSSEFRISGGGVIYPLGEDAFGQVIMTESGYMSAHLMRRNRPIFASNEQASGTPEEVRAALEGYVAYCGPFEIDLAQQKLITHVEGSMYPNWVGNDQERYFEITGDQLVLTTTPFSFGDQEFVGVLVWEKKL